MRVLLISANTEQINMPTVPLGLGFVAAATQQAGHEVTFLDLMFAKDPLQTVRRTINEFQPRAIGVSIRNIDDQSMESPRFLLSKVKPLIEAIRQSTNVPIILGGAGFSIFPQETLDYLEADMGIAGEGEIVFPQVLAQLEKGINKPKAPGLYLRDEGKTKDCDYCDTLDELPLPTPNQMGLGNADPTKVWLPIESRRGCPNECSYCSTSKIQGKQYRSRSPKRIVKYLAELAGFGYRQFYFVDNSFNIPESHALELCRLISQAGLDIHWRCIIYPHKLSEELVMEMKEAGCFEVALGFESGNRHVLKSLNKRFSSDDIRRASDLLKKHGIFRRGFLLLGAPGETIESVEESLAFANSLNLDALRITVGIRIYPDTALHQQACNEGFLKQGQGLLQPTFYLAQTVNPWIFKNVKTQ